MKTLNRIAKQLSALALTLMMASVSVNAQVPNDSIIADFNEFIRLLEETHPDPYTNSDSHTNSGTDSRASYHFDHR